MEGEISIDGLIAHLLSMGFEFDDCQGAINAGMMSADQAIDWIASKKKKPIPTGTSPSLKLQLPASKPHPPPSEEQTKREQSEGTAVTSRYSLTNKQRQGKARFHDKERETAKREAKQKREDDKKALEQIKRQIEDDRERQREKRQKPLEKKPQPSPESMPPAKKAFEVKDQCTLQIRLPNGNILRQMFKPSASLHDVADVISSQHKLATSVMFIQPFPRKEYSQDEMHLSLQTLGLTPTGSLVLRHSISQTPSSKTPATLDSSSKQSVEHPEEEEETAMDVENDGSESHNVEMDDGAKYIDSDVNDDMPLQLPGESDPNAIEMDDGSESDSGSSEDDDDDDAGGAPMNPHFPVPFHQPGHHFSWGSGQRLGGDPVREDASVLGQAETLAAADAAREAAIRRWTSPQEEVRPSSPEQCQLKQVQTLTDICVGSVAKRLPGYLVRCPLVTLGALPRSIVTKILKLLIREKTLRPKTLTALLPCRLKQLNLDCYSYVTNELLQAVGLHRSLTHLSCSSCPLVTDQGLAPLADLKRLQVLAFSGCEQLTDKCLVYVRRFRMLTSLKMNGTKITDTGLASYASYAPDTLKYLNLSGTQVTSKGLDALCSVKQLQSLEVENTNILTLQCVAKLGTLQMLSIANCSQLTDASMASLAGHPSLTALNLSGCTVGDSGLQYLAGLRLRIFHLPDRRHVTDQGLMALKDMPLIALNLTNFTNVTDVGIKHLANMTSLRRLSLDNTKVTDEGLKGALSGLLWVTELSLSKTNITNEGARVIACLTHLKELSLSCTRISNRLLKSGALDACVVLQKLNLSCTRVTENGVKALCLPHLTHLNVDSTKVVVMDAVDLPGLPNLKSLRCCKSGQPFPLHLNDSDSDESQ
eukprot:m.206150 g.206150  ORF g.206150 m.206150 type:complete len:875 (+) comp39668_c0_seq37:26-2650(+)